MGVSAANVAPLPGANPHEDPHEQDPHHHPRSPRHHAPRHASVYAAARPNHAALAPYATIADLLAVLVARSRLTADERDPILIAVVTEHQRTGHALWQSVLLKAFAPMLLHLRKRQGRLEGR